MGRTKSINKKNPAPQLFGLTSWCDYLSVEENSMLHTSYQKDLRFHTMSTATSHLWALITQLTSPILIQAVPSLFSARMHIYENSESKGETGFIPQYLSSGSDFLIAGIVQYMMLRPEIRPWIIRRPANQHISPGKNEKLATNVSQQ